MIVYWILFPLAGYIVGSIPFGLLLSKTCADIDITKKGSGNIGATNVSRELGIRWGIVTLILDAMKGFLPAFSACYLFPGLETLIILTGIFSFFGHLFPIFLKFRGGKGVATAIGVYLAIAPLPLVIGMLAFVITVFICDFVSLGSMIFAIAMPLLFVAFRYSGITVIGSVIIAIFICFKHTENIRRLINGKENRWKKKNSSK